MNLTIEFTGRFTATDAEISEACDRAKAVFAAAGKTVKEAWTENQQSLEDKMEMSDLWTQADYAATKDMGEGASLLAF